MKNLFPLFVLALVLVFTSCSKEELIIEETFLEEGINSESIMLSDETVKSDPSDISRIDITSFANVTELEISKNSSMINGNELSIDFISTEDFANSDLEAVQYLKFTNQNGSEVLYAFGVNSFAYSTNLLQVTFAIGANNLTGLELTETQSIIIVDEVVE